MKRILKTIGTVFGLLAVNAICIGIASIVTGALPEENIMLTVAIGNWLTLGALYIFLKDKEISFKKELNLNKISAKAVLYNILLGVGLMCVSLIIARVLINIFPEYSEIEKDIDYMTTSIIAIICVSVFIPIFEEIMFRGIIFNHLKANYTIKTAIIVQAILFGLAHGNILQGVYTFVSAIVFVLVNIYYDSIIPSMILHMVLNFIGVTDIEDILFFNDFLYSIFIAFGLLIFVYISFKMISNYKKRNIKYKYN